MYCKVRIKTDSGRVVCMSCDVISTGLTRMIKTLREFPKLTKKAKDYWLEDVEQIIKDMTR